MATEMQNTTDVQTVMVPLDKLVNLDAKVDGTELVKRGKKGMRSLNKNHVDRLAHSDYKQWPNLEAALKDGHIILVDGYHRREAAIKKGELNEHIEGEEGENGEIVNELPVNVRTYASDIAIVIAALEANIKHGLAASETSRTQLGIILLHEMVDKGEKPRFTETAKEVGISKVTLWDAWQKEIKAEEAEESEEGEEDEKASREKAVKAVVSFAKSMRSFIKNIEAIESDNEVASMLASALTEEDDKDTVTSVVNILKEAVKGIKKPTAKKAEKKPETKKLAQPVLLQEEKPTATTPTTKKSKTVKKAEKAEETKEAIQPEATQPEATTA